MTTIINNIPVEKIARDYLLDFYKTSFSKKPNENVFKFIDYSLGFRFNFDGSFKVSCCDIEKLSDLFYLLADDLAKKGEGIVLNPKNSLKDIADYYNVMIRQRTEEIYKYMTAVNPAVLVAVFDERGKYRLKREMIDISIMAQSHIITHLFNMVHAMYMLGELNPKLFDDSLIDPYARVFIAKSYVTVYKYLLDNPYIKIWHAVLGDAELSQLLLKHLSYQINVKNLDPLEFKEKIMKIKSEELKKSLVAKRIKKNMKRFEVVAQDILKDVNILEHLKVKEKNTKKSAN